MMWIRFSSWSAITNCGAYLPQAQRPWVQAILTRAYTHRDVTAARRLLQDLARRLDTDHPRAATSVREGLDETLTILGFGLSERLQRSLATTHAAEKPPEPDAARQAQREALGCEPYRDLFGDWIFIESGHLGLLVVLRFKLRPAARLQSVPATAAC